MFEIVAEITIEQQIEEVERELKIRERVYPRWVNAAKPKMTPAAAERQMERLRAVRASLLQLKQLRSGGTA